MAKIIELPGTGGTLRLAIDQNGWCSCSLLTTEERELGGEMISRLVPALSKLFTTDELGAVGEIDGHKVNWILTLSEMHYTLYVSKIDSEKTLFWQDPEARVVGKITLSEAESSEWRRQLVALGEELVK